MGLDMKQNAGVLADSGEMVWTTRTYLSRPPAEELTFFNWPGDRGFAAGQWRIRPDCTILCSFCQEVIVTVPIHEWIRIRHGCEGLLPFLRWCNETGNYTS